MGIIKKGKDYYIQYSLYVISEDGEKERVQKQEKIGPSRQLAEAALQKRLLERTEKKFFPRDEKEKPVTLAELTPKYLEFSKTNKSSKSYENDFYATKHLLGYFDSICLNEISPDKIEDYKLKRVAKVEPVSVNKELNCLRAMLNRAVEWGMLKESPIRKLRRYKEPPGRVRYLALEEIPRLLAVCAKHIIAVVIIALYTGMRKGEITRLRWRDIDGVNGFVHVESSKNYERRDIPMSEEVKELFNGMTRGPEESKVFPMIGDFKKAWWSSLKRAGITDFRFHDLRHTFASYLVMAGVSIMVVKELLGHKTLTMTLRYSHLAPDLRKSAIEALSKRLKNEPTC